MKLYIHSVLYIVCFLFEGTSVKVKCYDILGKPGWSDFHKKRY